MIKIKSEDSHQPFSIKFIGSIENYLKSVFGVKPINFPLSMFDKIKAFLKPQYDVNKVKEFLKKLDLFTDITEVSNIFYVKEKKSNISIKTKLNENNAFETVANLCFPNVYGSGESINFECLPLKGFQLLFKKPLLKEKSFSFLELKVFEEMKKLNDKKYQTRGFCVSQNTDSLSVGLKTEILSDKPFYSSFLNYHKNKYNLSINTGFTGLSPFLKLTGGFKIKWLWNRFYLKTDLQCGIIKGKSHPLTRFPLKNMIKEESNAVGGKSFVEVNNEVGVKFGNLNLFVRKDLAFNSNKNKLWGLLRNMRESLPEFKENLGVGFSYLCGGVNVGVAYMLKGGDNKYLLIFDAEM